MPLLDNPGNPLTATLGEFAAPFNSLFQSQPKYVGADFDGGFVIEEILAGADETAGTTGLVVTLVGEWMPHIPFKWGGTQKLQKDYYPGNSEPTVQIMGSRENDLKINGRFKVKRLQSGLQTDARSLCDAMAQAVDQVRKRGNLVRLTLGEWERYGFLEECNFTMKTLADIEYEITFFIIGATPPSNCKLTDEGLGVPTDINTNLINAGSALEAQVAAKPFDTMDLGLFGQINALVNTVATALSVVTKFVDTTIAAAEDVAKFANRAVGLIRYAQTSIAVFKRRVGQLDPFINNSPSSNPNWNETKNILSAKYVTDIQMATSKPPALSPAMAAAAKTKAASYTPNVSTQQQAAAQAGGHSIDKLLNDMLIKFASLAEQVPRFKHLVAAGDTLQTISMKYYKTADGWFRILTHNKLQTTELVPGTVLEIPK